MPRLLIMSDFIDLSSIDLVPYFSHTFWQHCRPQQTLVADGSGVVYFVVKALTINYFLQRECKRWVPPSLLQGWRMRVKAQAGRLRHRFRNYADLDRPHRFAKVADSNFPTLGPGFKNERIHSPFWSA